MKKYFFLSFVMAALISLGFRSEGQVKPPDAVKQAFQQKYPDATDTDYSNLLVETDVTFKENDANCKARFSNKGEWIATSKQTSFESLPEAVHDGFNKSKYADWQVDNVYEIYQPGKDMEYKIEVEKNTVQKKNLFFNTKGKMLRDNITI